EPERVKGFLDRTTQRGMDIVRAMTGRPGVGAAIHADTRVLHGDLAHTRVDANNNIIEGTRPFPGCVGPDAAYDLRLGYSNCIPRTCDTFLHSQSLRQTKTREFGREPVDFLLAINADYEGIRELGLEGMEEYRNQLAINAMATTEKAKIRLEEKALKMNDAKLDALETAGLDRELKVWQDFLEAPYTPPTYDDLGLHVPGSPTVPLAMCKGTVPPSRAYEFCLQQIGVRETVDTTLQIPDEKEGLVAKATDVATGIIGVVTKEEPKQPEKPHSLPSMNAAPAHMPTAEAGPGHMPGQSYTPQGGGIGQFDFRGFARLACQMGPEFKAIFGNPVLLMLMSFLDGAPARFDLTDDVFSLPGQHVRSPEEQGTSMDNITGATQLTSEEPTMEPAARPAPGPQFNRDITQGPFGKRQPRRESLGIS